VATYIKAPSDIVQMVEDAKAKWHDPLVKHGVTVGVLLANARRDEETGEPTGAALSHGGYPALGLIRLTNLRDRVAGLPDAMMLLDGDQWPELPTPRQVALIDHELSHIQLVKDDEGNVKVDDALRPRLKLRKHDIVVGGFVAVIERHKGEACEAVALVDAGKMMQAVFDFWG
jgi:hypothetical protein